MKKLSRLFVILLGITLSFTAYAQNKPRLAILPLSGGNSGDAETIAELFSFEPEINRTFVIVPRTSIVNAINTEQRFQRDGGLTNADNIKELGKRLNAEFVLTGSITAVAGNKLLLISIIHVEHLQQIAGAYHEYQKIEDVDKFLPDMARQIAAAAKLDTSSLRELSVIPIASNTGMVNQQDAEVLTQILATEIVKSGKFAVFPRTTSLEQVIAEHNNQRDGNTDLSTAKKMGIGENPGYVLSINVRNLGAKNMFTAAILNVVESSQGENGREDYETIADGIKLMPGLAAKLTGVPVSKPPNVPSPQQVQPPKSPNPPSTQPTPPSKPAQPVQPKPAQPKKITFAPSDKQLWSIGASVGSTFTAPAFTGTIFGTIAPFKSSIFESSFFEIGGDIGLGLGVSSSNYKDIDIPKEYYSFYPYAHYNFGLIRRNYALYFGLGMGDMLAFYSFPTGKVQTNNLAMDFVAGWWVHGFNLSLTIHTNFDKTTYKLAAGYSWRFR